MTKLFETINQFINAVGKANLIIACIIAIVLIIAILFYRSVNLKKYRKQLLDLDTVVNSVKSLPIQYRIGRVKKIAVNDESIVLRYETFVNKNDELNGFLNGELSELMNEVDEQLYFRKLSKIKSKLAELTALVDKYSTDANDLLKEIETITEIENEQRVNIIKIKEKYRDLINNYENVKYKVDELVPVLKERIIYLEDEFGILEDMMNTQLYNEARDKCNVINDEVDFLLVNVRDLPTYISVAKSFIPKRFAEIDRRIEDMTAREFNLEKLNAQSRFDTMKENLELALQDIVDLEIESVGAKLEFITVEINDLVTEFDQEEASHNEYLVIWKDIFKKISEVHEDYKYALTEYKKINDRYLVTDIKLDIEKSYPELETILDETKSLEHLIQSKDFSYATVVEHLKDLLAKSESYEDNLRYFFSKRDELYLAEQRAIDELESINIVLLEIKSELKNTHLPSISEKYIEYIEEAYERANNIQKLRNVLPLDLEELSIQANQARDVIYKLYDNVHNLVITAAMVEETIVYGNRYRSSFLEVNTELTKAELLFKNGEYSGALKLAVDIIEKIQPGFNKKLTANEVKNPAL